MRAFLLFWGICCLLSACDLVHRTPPTGFYQKEIALKNYEEEGFLGKVSIYVPNRYDTLLDWDDPSDCGCCGSKKYRLLGKGSCLIQESGFFHNEVCRDSFDRLSIVYQCREEGNIDEKVGSLILYNFADHLEEKIQAVWRNETIQWKAKKMIHINQQSYLFLHFISKTVSSRRPVEQIYAGTFFDNTLILFIYENNLRDRAEFIREAYTSIASIKLSLI